MSDEFRQFLHLMSAVEWLGLLAVLLGSAALWGAEAFFWWRKLQSGVSRRFAGPSQTPNPKPQTSRLWLLLHALAFVYLLAFLYGIYVEPNRLVQRRLVLETDKLPAGTTLRLVHVSDLHAQASATARLERAADAIAALRPDLILMTGDYLCDYRIASLTALLGFIFRLPDTPVIAVPGNYGGLYPADPLLETLGIENLHTEWREVTIRGVPLEILGLSPSRNTMKVPPPRHPERFGIVLEHFPVLLPRAAAVGWDLYLAGHTHGGQVRLPLYGALVTLDRTGKQFEWGAYRLGRTVGEVTDGLGLECRGWPQVRFLAPPEIVLIELRGTGGR